MAETLHGHAVSDLLARFSESVSYDRALFREDIAGSRAHARMLNRVGLLADDELQAILDGLDGIEQEIAAGGFAFNISLEDIHTHVEKALTERIGAAGAKLHTGRSRNDQIATDERLWVRARIDRLTALIAGLQRALAGKAHAYAAQVMPGFTHLQHAMPVTAGHVLLAYVEMLERDRTRLLDARARVNICPLGSGALAGSTLPLDRQAPARELGFDGITQNSLDAVSDRDYLLEFLFCLSTTAVHLSRFCEDLVNWSSDEFQFVTLGREFCTGSSMMPQKRNPDVPELVRGRAGRVIGSLVSLLVTLKGLPLAYNRDLQEDKEPVFDAARTMALSLEILGAMVPTMEFNAERLERAVRGGFLDATALSDYLVRRGMPFREAHRVVASLVARAQEQGRAELSELDLEAFQAASSLFTQDVYNVLGAHNALQANSVVGGPAPARVREQAHRWLNGAS